MTNPTFRTAEDHRAMQVAARAYLERQGEAQAGCLLRTGWERAREQDNQVALVGWLQVSGMAADRQDGVAEAQRTFAKAASLAALMPYPYEEARTLSAWGHMLIRAADLRAGREKLIDALAIFHRLGAQPDAERVEQALTDHIAG